MYKFFNVLSSIFDVHHTKEYNIRHSKVQCCKYDIRHLLKTFEMRHSLASTFAVDIRHSSRQSTYDIQHSLSNYGHLRSLVAFNTGPLIFTCEIAHSTFAWDIRHLLGIFDICLGHSTFSHDMQHLFTTFNI